jgi:hypothetical protein
MPRPPICRRSSQRSWPVDNPPPTAERPLHLRVSLTCAGRLDLPRGRKLVLASGVLRRHKMAAIAPQTMAPRGDGKSHERVPGRHHHCYFNGHRFPGGRPASSRRDGPSKRARLDWSSCASSTAHPARDVTTLQNSYAIFAVRLTAGTARISPGRGAIPRLLRLETAHTAHRHTAAH